MGSGPQRSAEQVVRRLCRALAARDLGVGRWALEPHRDGLLVSLIAGGTPLALLLSPRHDGQAYAETPSLSLSVHGDVPAEGIEPQADELLKAFVALLRRMDKGDLDVETARPDEAAVPAAASRVGDDLRQRQRWSAYLGYRTLLYDDLYPHVSGLGERLDDDEILDGWRDAARRIRQGRAPSKLGLYLHIPFCSTVCTYCFCGRADHFDARAFERHRLRIQGDIERFGPLVDGCTITSVYVGGGTPSLLPAAALQDLFTRLYSSFHVPAGTQVVFEGNPNSLTEEKIGVLATHGRVTRLTIGVQTLDPVVQRRVNRVHAPAKVERAVQAARKHHIPHINVDLLAGLPDQTRASFENDLRRVIDLGPHSIHVNAFRPVPSTLFARGGESLDAEQRRRRDEMVAWAKAELAGSDAGEHEHGGLTRPVDTDNLQEYDLRRQNSSLLGMGFAARSHSFANHYYQSDVRDGFDVALHRELDEERPCWIGVRVDELEEQHKYLVRNFRTGFLREEFRSLFGRDAVDAHPERFADLFELGIYEAVDDMLRARPMSSAEALCHRALLYSDRMLERARERWGADFDASVDYQRLTERLTGQAT